MAKRPKVAQPDELFLRAFAQAGKNYRRATAKPWGVYEAATAPDRKIYDEEIALAIKARDKTTKGKEVTSEKSN